MKSSTVSLALAGALISPLWSQTPGLPESFKGRIGLSFKESVPDWASLTRSSAPKGAPNVVLILLEARPTSSRPKSRSRRLPTA